MTGKIDKNGVMADWERAYQQWTGDLDTDALNAAIAAAPPLAGVALLVFKAGRAHQRAVSSDTLVKPNAGAAATYDESIVPVFLRVLGDAHSCTRMAQAERALHGADVAEKIRAMNAVRASFSGGAIHTRATVNLAFALFQAGQLQQALEIVETLDPIGPVHCDTWTGAADLAALLYERLGLFERAVEKLRPGFLLDDGMLGWFSLRANRPKQAEQVFAAHVEFRPWDITSRLGLVWALLLQSKWDEARAALASIDPNQVHETSLFDETVLACEAQSACALPALIPSPSDFDPSYRSMFPDLVALLWPLSEEPQSPVAVDQLLRLAEDSATPMRLRQQTAAQLRTSHPSLPRAHLMALRTSARVSVEALESALGEMLRAAQPTSESPNTSADTPHTQLDLRAFDTEEMIGWLGLLTGANLRLGDVNEARLALAETMLERVPALRNTHGEARLREMQGRWHDVVVIREALLARAEVLTPNSLQGAQLELEHAMDRDRAGSADARRATRQAQNLKLLAELSSQIPARDVRLRERILPALFPYVRDDGYRLGVHEVPLDLLIELIPVISRRHFYRLGCNAQPSLKALIQHCMPHRQITTLSGWLTMHGDMRFHTVITMLTPETLTAFETADELGRICQDRVLAWWD